jgi:hypothetical protein
MHRSIVVLVLTALVGLTGRAEAVIGTVDDVPAATLLLPYFEVDPNDPAGINTGFTIRNTSSAPVVAHVTVWTNLSVPVLTFDVYLTGFDQEEISMRNVLLFGFLPQTGPASFLSPLGPLSEPHNTFGGTCSTTPGMAPFYDIPALPAAFLAHLQAALSGAPSALSGDCAGMPTESFVGYVTIDAANQCNSLLFPSSVGYFAAGGQGVASNRNVLSGDWLLIDPTNDRTQADSLVHLEASASDPLTSTPGSYTFYGRYVGGSAIDNRERLPAQWNVPLDPLVEAGGSAELLVWRDSGFAVAPFPCASPPAIFPLSAAGISTFDPNGAGTPLALSSFPWTTQRVAIAQAGSSLRANLDTSTGSAFDPAKQAYVIDLRRGSSPLLSTGMGAVQEAGTGRLGTAEAAPGASLLLPYFEVEPGNPNGVRTALSVRNGSPLPVLARVVLWTDLSLPTLGFELYLPGFGSRIVDLRGIFLTGALPASGPAPLPDCAGRLPPAPLSAASLAALTAAHTGLPSPLFGGLCGGSEHGDAVARGYLTADVVSRCTNAFPGQAGYFGAGGAAAYDNVLWGDYAVVEPAENMAHGDPLVHLQASTTDPLTATAGKPTFYGRYVGGTAADHREALPHVWGVVSRRSGVFSGGSQLLVWRDTGHVNLPFACGLPPAAFPLGQGSILHFDAHHFHPMGAVPPFALGLAAQKRTVDWPGPDFGWISLDLRTRTGAFSQPPLQAHVTSVERSLGRFSVSTTATQLPPKAALFADGFENGNVAAWAFKVP